MFLKPFISAPVDITIMLVGAFLIGSAIAWLLRNQKINLIEGEIKKLQAEVRNLHIANENLESLSMGSIYSPIAVNHLLEGPDNFVCKQYPLTVRELGPC